MNKGQVVLVSLLILMIGACSSKTESREEVSVVKLSPQEFSEKLTSLEKYNLIDVRSPQEFATNRINKAVNIDVNGSSFNEKISVLEKDVPVLVYCKSGGRSATAADQLVTNGFTVYELEGGIINWQSQGLEIQANTKKSNSGYTMASYNEAVENGLVLVDFYATWCGPCKMMAPHIEELKSEFGDEVKVVKVDTDKSIEVATNFKITGIPLVKIYKDGKEVYNKIGYHTKQALKKELEKHS